MNLLNLVLVGIGQPVDVLRMEGGMCRAIPWERHPTLTFLGMPMTVYMPVREHLGGWWNTAAGEPFLAAHSGEMTFEVAPEAVAATMKMESARTAVTA